MAFHFSIFKLSVISRLIWPYHYTLTVHIVIFEITFVNFTWISKIVFPFTVKLSVNEITIVIASIKLKSSPAGFFTLWKLSSISYLSFVPSFGSHTMLLIIFPLSFIHWTFDVNKDSMAISFSILPVALIDISILMRHPSLSMENFVLGYTLVHWAILELNLSKTNPLGSFFIPVASVFLFLIGTFLPVIFPEDISSVSLDLFFEFWVT